MKDFLNFIGRVRLFLGDIYYKYFSEFKRDVNYVGTTAVDRLFHSIFYIMMGRILFFGISMYLVSECGLMDNYDYYGTEQVIAAILGGYLFTPLFTQFLIPKEHKVKFMVGGYIPFPMTIVWVFGK